MDGRRQQTDIVTGRTFNTSTSVGSYSQSQISPYVQPRLDYGTNYSSSNARTGNVSQNKSQGTSYWDFDDPEFKRRRRVASYKVYTMEGRVKSSLRKSVRWIKNKYLEIRYGW